jgi:YVTN family beta-propeller protein
VTDLPSGAVSFLFTDVEGSTRLVKQLRERWDDVLRDHQRLLRNAFAAHGGHEVDTQGDSFFVAFSSARDAVLAAAEGQLALQSHPWPEGAQIRVRMGVHTGQAVASEGRYTGLAVHRAARIAAAAHGGQILVSQATQTLLEDEEEDLHVSFRDLGEQRLKDLDRPVRIYQVAADGLPAAFPAIRSGVEADAAPRAWWRRGATLGAAAAVVLLAVAAALVLLARSREESGLGEVSPNHVGVIDPATDRVVAEIPVGIRPGPIAAGEGTVWVGNLQDRSLTRIDVRRRTPAGTIPLDNLTPTGIDVGLGGVWVAHGLTGQLSVVDPQFGRVTHTLDVAAQGLSGASGAVAVGDGAVWATYGDSTLARIDPAVPRVLASGLAGSSPTAIVVGNGFVWVANSGDASVDRFNPATFRQGPLRTFNVGRSPSGLAYGERALWVTLAGDDAVARIDPGTGPIVTIPVGRAPTGVAVGAGAVWVANSAGRTVSRIDPATNQVVRTIPVGNVPVGIAIAGGLVWVTIEAP